MNCITFNEITKDCRERLPESTKEIDMNLVDAQQACRVLDRMVGYTVSVLFCGQR